jgi:hypothetical protein
VWTSDAIVRSLERFASYPGWAYVVARPHPAFRSTWRDRSPDQRAVRETARTSIIAVVATNPREATRLPREPREVR